jgi:hypothetical protein
MQVCVSITFQRRVLVTKRDRCNPDIGIVWLGKAHAAFLSRFGGPRPRVKACGSARIIAFSVQLWHE